MDALAGALEACLKKQEAPGPKARGPLFSETSAPSDGDLAGAMDAWDVAPDLAQAALDR